MHELSITESILDIALKHAKEAKAKRITNIYLVIGKLSSFVDDAVQFYWDFVSKNTPAEGAILNFRRIQPEFSCRDCGFIYYPNDNDLACPNCQGTHIKINSGDEFFLEAIDIETE